jgi:hypothetical protein
MTAAVSPKRPGSITVGCNGQAILTMAGRLDQHAAWIEGYLLRGRDGLDSATLARMAAELEMPDGAAETVAAQSGLGSSRMANRDCGALNCAWLLGWNLTPFG